VGQTIVFCRLSLFQSCPGIPPCVSRPGPDAALANVIAGNQRRRVESHGRKIRSKALRAFRDGQFCGVCPTCGIDVYILVGRHDGEHYGAFCAVGQGLPDPTFSKVNIRPCGSSELPEVARELYSLCVDSGDAWLGDWVCRLFGTSTCPRCRKPFDVAEAVAASDGIRRVYSASGLLTMPSPPEWRGVFDIASTFSNDSRSRPLLPRRRNDHLVGDW